MTLIDANQTVTTSFANNIVTTPIVKRAAIPSSGVKYTVKTFERWKEEFPWIERHPSKFKSFLCFLNYEMKIRFHDFFTLDLPIST